LEHIPKEETIVVLKAIYAALSPSGRLIIEVPNMANPLIGLNVRYADFTHEVGFTELSLQHVLKVAGFKKLHLFESRLSPDRWSRPIQNMIQRGIKSGLGIVYRAYGLRRPSIVGRALCGVAFKDDASR
jgi:hypothetical protein